MKTGILTDSKVPMVCTPRRPGSALQSVPWTLPAVQQNLANLTYSSCESRRSLARLPSDALADQIDIDLNSPSYADDMNEMLGPILGAIAVTGIPLVTWISSRATKERRLILRVNRLGGVYALMPESSEKDTFERHVTRAISKLNAWLDFNTARRRQIMRWVSGSVYVVGVSVAFAISESVDAGAKTWVSPLVGGAVGVAIPVLSSVTARVLDRNELMKSAAEKKASDEAATASRIQALSMGIPVHSNSFDGESRA